MTTAPISLHYREQGGGTTPVLFIHGNLGCGDWVDLVARELPSSVRLIAPDWRGCGDSPKPEPAPDYANYGMAVHAADMLALLDRLEIGRCHLFTHSTGDLIATHMLLAEPERFGRIFSLSPVGPMGLPFAQSQLDGFRVMRDDMDVARMGLATAVSSLFEPESLGSGGQPRFRAETSADQRTLFEHLLGRTRVLSDGVWLGTPYHLDQTYRSGQLRRRQAELTHPRRIVRGREDAWIPLADVEEMAECMPGCELQLIDGIGHSMNVEAPEACAASLLEFLTLDRD
ncbi:alpha/beta fold hydrolase [Aquisalimonas sp. APHAB1-3]|uniref:alpha/beta fold hydrolase n=1 Tax=Aquisalimonas sp. APHAB1-3 TaxID=3402080 RepID=UPI003AAA29AB